MTIYADIFSVIANPSIPILFQEDVGTATPAANILNILGGAGIATSGSGNTVTISATGSGFKWQDQGVSLNPALVENGYFATAAITITLPAAPVVGNSIAFIVDTTSALTIKAVGAQIIRLGTIVSAAAGTAVSTSQGDSIELVFRATNNCWESLSSVGTWIIT